MNLEQSAIILSVQVIFQAAIRYSSEAWENVLRSHIIPITGNALREVPVTVQLILTGKLLDSILLRTYSDFNHYFLEAWHKKAASPSGKNRFIDYPISPSTSSLDITPMSLFTTSPSLNTRNVGIDITRYCLASSGS